MIIYFVGEVVRKEIFLFIIGIIFMVGNLVVFSKNIYLIFDFVILDLGIYFEGILVKIWKYFYIR